MTPTLVLVACILGLVLVFVWAKHLKARRAEFIREFSLPPGLFDKLREKHPHLSLKDCQLVGRALRHFFLAYLKSGRRYISMPSQVVDDLWHEFILYTRHYSQFCRGAFGRFLHHTPAAALGDQQRGNDGLRRCWWQACREENINPQRPTRLPLLFALDRKLRIKNGFRYVIDCSNAVQAAKVSDGALPIYCAAELWPVGGMQSGSSCGGGGNSCTGSSARGSHGGHGNHGGGHGHGSHASHSDHGGHADHGGHGCSGSACSGGCGGGD